MEAYLDNSATTRAYPEVGDLVYKVMCQDYGNPSSMHRKGVDAEHYVKEAKETIEQAEEAGAIPITLGKRILRTETAGLTTLSILMYHLECREQLDDKNIR